MPEKRGVNRYGSGTDEGNPSIYPGIIRILKTGNAGLKVFLCLLFDTDRTLYFDFMACDHHRLASPADCLQADGIWEGGIMASVFSSIIYRAASFLLSDKAWGTMLLLVACNML